MTLDYNKSEADKIFKKYNSLSGFDPLIKTRKDKAVYFRCLLYKVLMDFNYMNDRQITHYFLSLGRKINRSSVFTSLTKIDFYYKYNLDFRILYDLYFEDKIKENIIIKEKKKNRLDALNKRIDATSLKFNNDPLQVLINNLPLDKRDEVFEMLNLRVKSWAWKSKDNCEIIQ